MSTDEKAASQYPGSAARFATTRWSLVAKATRSTDELARAALGELCSLYCEPIYAYFRCIGKSPDDAADLTQGFIARLLEKGDVAGADPDRGRFRSFLLGAIKHYAQNEAARMSAQKRGAGATHCSLDAQTAEAHFAREQSSARTPEALFQRRWALGVLERALRRLGERYAAEGKGSLFAAMSPLLSDKDSAPYGELAQRLGMSENAVKVAAYRLRARYRETIRSAIVDTVQSPAEVDDELRFLMESL